MPFRHTSPVVARLRGAATIAAALAVLAAAPAVHATPPALPPALLDGARDRVEARTVVPDASRKVGEVRLVARGDATVVQTVLLTRVLPRVVAEIRKKEEANWPPGAAGHGDMTRYVAALEDAAATLRAAPDVGGDRRRRLLIEFVASPDAAAVVLAGFAGAERDGAITVGVRTPLAVLAVGRAYVLRNMRLILADAFHAAEADVGRLGPLGPAAAPAATPPRP